MFAELTPYLVGLGAAALAVTAWLAVGGATTRRLALRQINRRRGEAALVVAGNRPTEASLPDIEKVLDSLVAVAFPPAEALRVILSIGNYVIGCAVERQAEEARTADPERDTRLLEQAAALPNLRAAIAGVDRPGPAAGDAGFEYGLGLLIDGVRARHAELLSAAPGRPVPAG
jgi:TetR/AcrR family tetracycline transcriptional repressor